MGLYIICGSMDSVIHSKENVIMINKVEGGEKRDIFETLFVYELYVRRH